jgi:hypothetical protein
MRSINGDPCRPGGRARAIIDLMTRRRNGRPEKENRNLAGSE